MVEHRHILMLKGLPCSGKTTFALEHLKTHKNYLRWNRDCLREMISGEWDNTTDNKEKLLRKLRKDFIIQAFNGGYNVILDDCNLDPSNMEAVEKIKEEYKDHFDVDITTTSFEEVPLHECEERNEKREKKVPVGVIREMYTKYLAPYKEPPPPYYYSYSSELLDCVVCDIDGTLAIKNGRQWYEYDRVGEDLYHVPVVEILKKLSNFYSIIIVSGRDDSCYEKTKKWLLEGKIPFNRLYLRKTGDHRSDPIVKEEMWRNYMKDQYNIVVWLDDRKKVIDHMRELGIPVWEVREGNF